MYMIYENLLRDARFGAKKLALLIDPDKQDAGQLEEVAREAQRVGVDYLLVGGSLLTRDTLNETVRRLKQESNLPVLLFPGSSWQITGQADALLYLSLISGRNADLLIGQQVQAAPLLDQMDLEVIPTGYMLIDGGAPTTVSYITQTAPIPSNKPDIAVATALAGKYLGMQVLYLDAGSGARNPVPPDMIRQVKCRVDLPLLVGGGIRTPDQAVQALRNGADIVVIGTAIERDPTLLADMAQAVQTAMLLAN